MSTQAARQADTVRNPGTDRLHTIIHTHTHTHICTGTHAYRQTHREAAKGKGLSLQPQGHIKQNPTKVMLVPK